MHTWTMILIYVVVSIGLALGGLHLVRQRFPHPVRQANNEVAGYFLSVIGVMYAVLMAFVIVVVWQQFDDTRVTTEREGNALAALYRLAGALPEPDGSRIRGLLRDYAQTMIDDEWPAMARGQTSAQSQAVADQVWLAVTRRQDERLIQAELLQRLNDLNDNSRSREMAAKTSLPSIMWGLLIGGAVVSVVFTYFFSTPNPRAQYGLTALYVASIAFVLVLARLLDFPFAGDVHISSESFERALETFNRLDPR